MEDKERLTILEVVDIIKQIDPQSLIKLFGSSLLIPAALYFGGKYVTKRAINAYNLHKSYKPRDIKEVELQPLILDDHTIDYNEINKKLFSDSVLKFIDVMKKNFNDAFLNNFYRNLKNLTVEEVERDKDDPPCEGVYYATDNRVAMTKGSTYVGGIFHELFHMASSAVKGDMRYIGFRQYNVKTGVTFGVGLNEGYTQLLAERYFDLENDARSYIFQSDYAKMIEDIVGKDKMEGLYLNANLSGLIKELKKYISEEEIMRFIADLDFLTKNLSARKPSRRQRALAQKCFNRLNRFIIICYARKTINEYQFGDLFSWGASVKIIDYISKNITTVWNINGYRYKVMDEDGVKEVLDEAFSIYDKAKVDRSLI